MKNQTDQIPRLRAIPASCFLFWTFAYMSSLPFTGRRSATVAATVAATPYRPQAHFALPSRFLCSLRLRLLEHCFYPKHLHGSGLTKLYMYNNICYMLYIGGNPRK